MNTQQTRSLDPEVIDLGAIHLRAKHSEHDQKLHTH